MLKYKLKDNIKKIKCRKNIEIKNRGGKHEKPKQAKQNRILAGEKEAIQLNQLYGELETNKTITEDEESTQKDEMIKLLQQ